MSHIQYTICRNGQLFYNRRTPKDAVDSYGAYIRIKLHSDHFVAGSQAQRLTTLLDDSFRSGRKLDLQTAIDSMIPKRLRLSDVVEEYLDLKPIDPKPTRLAVEAFFSVAGDREIADYTREDAKAFLFLLEQRGNSTGTIRRRINSISAILNYGFAELDIDKRNPFSRLVIKAEGLDRKKRGTFTTQQLQEGYQEALGGKSSVRLLMPILGETGCRLAEIVGLRVEDVDLEAKVLRIRPNAMRRLKTAGSERDLPIVGGAEEALRKALSGSEDGWVFPRYIHDDGCRATHASNALNKWLKGRFGGLTAHSLRHTMRDRLRAVEAPLELIDQVGGWSSVNNIGSRYGQGYKIDQLAAWLDSIKVCGD